MSEFVGISSARVRRLREKVLDKKSTIDTARAKIYTRIYQEQACKPLIIRRALALRATLEEMPIFIDSEELIVGNQAADYRSAPIFPEYAIDWLLEELDEFAKRPGDAFIVTEAQKQEIREMAEYWQGITLKDKALAMMNKESLFLYDVGMIRAEGNITSGDGHIAVDFSRILTQGTDGLKKYTQRVLDKLDIANFEDYKKQFFLQAVLIVLDAVVAFAHRFADLAEEQKIGADKKRVDELQRIADVCRRVPEYPAETFREAVQSTWFIQLILQIESNGHSVSYGRMDQYLNDFYVRDLTAGRTTEEEATELLELLWIKTYSIHKIRSWSHTRFSAGSPLYQNVTVGGQKADGSDAVNALSCQILKSVGRVRFTQPNLTVRYHKNLSKDFLEKAFEIVKLGFGMPAFNSDEVIIPSLLKLGVSHDDAYNYSAIGCVEVAVPGKWGYRCTGMSFLNFAKVLMTALNNGVEPLSGAKIHEGVGKHFTEMTCFDEVFSAWSKTVRYFTRQAVIMDMTADYALEMETPDVLCSALTDDCIARGKTIKEGGSVYDFISDLQVGIANLGNSLAVIKKLVFDEKKLTTKELWQALESDFSGADGERIRQMCLNLVPKYGNDDDYVDRILVAAYNECIDEYSHYHSTRYGRGPIGGSYYAGTSSISANVPQGSTVGATPDGRQARAPLAEGCSPSGGSDVKGSTAVYKSLGKLPNDKITGGVLLNQKISPAFLYKAEDTDKLIGMMRTFFDKLKGFHVQYNIVDRATLLDAQKHPEKHKNLIVRVAGYSAFFNVLTPETQNDIIKRTEQILG